MMKNTLLNSLLFGLLMVSGLGFSGKSFALYDDGSCDVFGRITLMEKLKTEQRNYMCKDKRLIYQTVTEEFKKAKYVFDGKEYNYKNMAKPLTLEHQKETNNFEKKISNYENRLIQSIKNKTFLNNENVFTSLSNEKKSLYKEMFEKKYYNYPIIETVYGIDDLLKSVCPPSIKDFYEKNIQEREKFLKLLNASYH
ncbi:MULTISPECIES: hypothetical protein [unclassified Lonepinella]|uniref:hypothetical protein n=1 Tax=unclassified Lonepinella TaxID=2642006 RepID=UPI003F6E233E